MQIDANETIPTFIKVNRSKEQSQGDNNVPYMYMQSSIEEMICFHKAFSSGCMKSYIAMKIENTVHMNGGTAECCR